MGRPIFHLALVALLAGCSTGNEAPAAETANAAPAGGGQASVSDDVSQPDVVKVAVKSPDHSTLVAAVKAAGLTDALSNAGPFTVFAPTNAAFDALPAGTVDNLLKPENKGQLKSVLYHHVTTSALDVDAFSDGQSVTMVDGPPETFSRRDGKAYIGDAQIIGSVRASNGWVHVIDKVLVPAAKP